MQSIYAKSGLKGFYSGMTGLLARDIPYRAMQLPLYEVARDAYAATYCHGRDIQPAEVMAVGAAVGMLAAGLTTPFDVVKSRMMVGTSTGCPCFLSPPCARALCFCLPWLGCVPAPLCCCLQALGCCIL